MSNTNQPILEIRSLSHIYGEGTPFRHVALDNVNLKLYQGELVGLIGHTGSGKSTLIQHFNGLLRPTSGQVLLRGEDIFATKTATRNARFAVGLVMQYPEYQLFEDTVRKDIAFGPKNKGITGVELERVILEACDAVNLPRRLLDSSPFELSGGEKRRAAIAGIIAMEPDLLILDEPTAGLDPKGREEILETITAYRKNTGKTVLFVSHSMDTVANVCNRILVMNRSHIAMDASPAEVFSRTEELRNMGLALPDLTDIFVYMQNRGLPISDPVYTMDYAVRKLAELISSEKEHYAE
ncbi:MAG: energy-coupling factor transporter ATPase [Clostridia bacterium]|nr:energy-coupling factor transporter ATPase [Clostridia bacterium]